MEEREHTDRVLRSHWPTVRLGELLGGGHRNVVWAALNGSERVVVRHSRRSERALRWELDLVVRLAGLDFIVPAPIVAGDGRRHHGGVCVLTWVEGDPPVTEADWHAVTMTLQRLHRMSAGWPQRPGFASIRELLRADSGGDVDLRDMPPDAALACRVAWARIATEPQTVVHGDPGAGNVRISRNGAGLIDWDEARVDASVLDFAEHPHACSLIHPPGRYAAVLRAATAWEAANGWNLEPDYARRKLADLEALGEP